MPDKRRWLRGEIRRAVGKARIRLGHDIHQTNELFFECATVPIVDVVVTGHARRSFPAAGLGRILPDVKIIRQKTRIRSIIGAVAVVINYDVGINLDVAKMQIVDHVPEVATGAVACL